ncbi:MAG: SusD/RagB family nutrient-binding outer membrane lipoprotein [Daejeonella sp.]
MKKIYSLILASLLLFAACKPGDFGDTNVDPTTVSSVPTKALLTNSLQSLPGTAFGITSALFYVQHASEGPYPGASLYATRNFNWDFYYTGPLYNLQKIIDYNNEDQAVADPSINGSKNNQIAVARIMKAYYFWFLTDRYGDIPYTDALKGDGNFSPSYTPQKDIYYDLFKEMKEAEAQINVSEKGVVGDILLNGDMAQWKKFANTASMMMALRLIKNDYAKGKTEFSEAVARGVISDNSENVTYNYLGGDPNNYNPLYVNYTVDLRNDYAISNTLVDYMAPKNDPRLPVYGEVLGGTVKGLPYGSDAAKNIPGAYSRIGDAFRGAGSPATIFSYAQVLFSLAEGVHVGYVAGSEQTYYQDAIMASFEQNGVYTPTAFANYLAQPGITYNATNAYEQIMTQKWVSLYLNGYESWADWRRTGFPVLTPAESGAQSTIPRRQGYPVSEKAINGEAYTAAVALQGPDNLTTRMWWDK